MIIVYNHQFKRNEEGVFTINCYGHLCALDSFPFSCGQQTKIAPRNINQENANNSAHILIQKK